MAASSMRTRRCVTLYLVSGIALVGGIAACGGMSPTTAVTDMQDLPLLAVGRFLGVTSYGNAPSPEEGAARAIVTGAASAGMNAFAFGADWQTMEPTRGTYDLGPVEERLRWLESLGVVPYFNVAVVDITDLNLPPDLLSTDGGRLAPGVRFDDSAVIGRFNALLDRLVPLLVRHGGFYLGVGNEVDARFEDFPEEMEPYLAFVRAVREHARGLEPELAVGATVTGSAVLDRRPTFTRLRTIADVVPFNFYNIDPASFLVTDRDRTLADLDRAISNYGDGPIIIQELGCSSAAAQGSSEEIQRACFEAYFDVLPRRYTQVRFAAVFTLSDLDPATCDLVVSFFGVEDEGLPPEIVARLRGFFCEIGLRAPDGSTKPAWDEFLRAVGDLD